MLIIIIIFIYHFNVSKENVLYIPYQIQNGKYYINLQLANPPKNFTMCIDIASKFTYIYKQSSKLSRSDSIRYRNLDDITIGNINLKGKRFSDTLIIPSLSLSMEFYEFYVLENLIDNIDDSIGFGFKQDFYQSFMSYLFSLKKIEKKVFGFVKETDNTGKMYLGNFPLKLVEEKQLIYIGKVQVSKNFNAWGVNLQGLKFHLYSRNINQYFYFTTNDKRIIVSKDIIYNIFNSVYMDFGCQYKVNMKEQLNFECNCEKITKYKFPEISFNFGNNLEFSFNKKELFEDSNTDSCLFLIEGKDDTISSITNNQWVFGTTFLNKYPTFFDYNQEEISFYSYNNFNVLDFFEIKKIILLINILLLFLNCLIILAFIPMYNK